jgi:hypothetical protein
MSKKAQTTEILREKELLLIRRAGTSNWQIHYKVKSINKWVCKSAGTDDLKVAKVAKAAAEDIAADIRAAERRGLYV